MIRVDMLACACVCVCVQGSDGILKVDMVEPRLAQDYNGLTVCLCRQFGSRFQLHGEIFLPFVSSADASSSSVVATCASSSSAASLTTTR